MKTYQFISTIHHFKFSEGFIQINIPVVSYKCPMEIKEKLELLFRENLRISTQANLSFLWKEDLNTQEYKIEIVNNHISILYGDIAGAVYASITLKHMIAECKGYIPNGSYSDKPQFLVRGLLYDISRNKVPKLETLYRLVDIMWELKYNQLQLYLEGLSYEYSNYQEYLEEECYITKKEMKSLNSYCKDRQINLVANQNTLGHMAKWLEIDTLKDLKKTPEGELAFGKIQPCATLDPKNPRSKKLIENMTQDLLEAIDSKEYNVNLDEVFGLENEKEFADWAEYLKELTYEKGKRMLMWSDMINIYPQLVEVIPKDTVLLDWGYEDNYPFHMECSLLKENGYDFYVCPGTSSWCSIAGRTSNMIKNVDSAILNGIKYGAIGIMNTDWGDQGHWQTFPISFPGVVAVGLASWSGKALEENYVSSYLDSYVYHEETGRMGKLVMELGDSYLLDEVILINGSFLHHNFIMGLCSSEEKETYIQKMLGWMIPYAKRFEEFGDTETVKRLQSRKSVDIEKQRLYIENIAKELQMLQLRCRDKSLIVDEYSLSIFMLNISLDLREYLEVQDILTKAERKMKLQQLKKKFSKLTVEFQEVWLSRNKKSHLQKSMESFLNISNDISQKLLEE